MLYLLGQLPQVALGYLKHDQVQIKMCYKCKMLLQDYKDLLTSECVCVCGCVGAQWYLKSFVGKGNLKLSLFWCKYFEIHANEGESSKRSLKSVLWKYYA